MSCETSSDNDVEGLAVNSLSIDNGVPENSDRSYHLYGHGITLGEGGITYSTHGSYCGFTNLELPITLSASQTWSFNECAPTIDAAVNGPAARLGINLSDKSALEIENNFEVGPLTITAPYSGLPASESEAGFVAVTNGGDLNGTDGNAVTLNNAALIGDGTTGPLTSIGGYVVPFAILTSAGGVTLDPTSAVDFAILPGQTAGTDYWQLRANGTVTLGGARLEFLRIHECPTLTPGEVDTLVTTTGSLVGTFAEVPDGKTVSLSCELGTPPTVRINYTAHTVTATVVGREKGGEDGLSLNSESSPIGGSTLPGGPVSGGTPVTIKGSGFVPGVTQVWFGTPGNPSARVTVLSSTELIAVTPSVPDTSAGLQTLAVYSPGGIAYATFHYFVPQIGTLVFRDPSLARSNEKYYSYCTGSVVSSNNRDVVATAGHCVTSGTTWHDEVVFAPGYYGATCPVSHHPVEALCGVSPYSQWPVRLLVANEHFRAGTGQGVDYGFMAAQTLGGKHIQEVVGGGLAISFCQGASIPFHPTCDSGSGSQEQNWIAYGEPDPSRGLVHCGPGATITSEFASLVMTPCAAVTEGSSGGPWLSGADVVGAVNEGHCQPPKCATPQTSGTYLGSEAREAFDEVQGGGTSATAMGVVSQNANVNGRGVAAIRATCPEPSICRGVAELTSPRTAAVAAVAKTVRHHYVLVGRARFAIRSNRKSKIHVRIGPWARSLLQHRRTRLLATLTLRVIYSAAIKIPITLSR